METGSGGAAVPHVQAKVDLKVGEIAIKTSVPVPRGKTTARYMLPVMQAFTDVIVKASAELSARQRRPASCRMKCSACCYQLVPLSEPEVFALVAKIEAMPEPRRTEVKARFEAMKQRLREVGLLDAIGDLGGVYQEQFDLAMVYLQARIPCPFLEEDLCSIHRERPMACREYMVWTNPVHCSNPAGKIAAVDVAASMGGAVAMASTPAGSPMRRIALPLALDYAASHVETAEMTGVEYLNAVMSNLTGKNRPIKLTGTTVDGSGKGKGDLTV